MSYDLSQKSQKGFTLVEIILVIAILAILGGVVIMAINPSRQFVVARDAERRSEVFAIVNALHQYARDHESSFPEDITTTELEICRTASQSCEGKQNLSSLTDNEAYLVTVPVDPVCEQEASDCEESATGYVLSITDTGRIRVAAIHAELEEIVVTK